MINVSALNGPPLKTILNEPGSTGKLLSIGASDNAVTTIFAHCLALIAIVPASSFSAVLTAFTVLDRRAFLACFAAWFLDSHHLESTYSPASDAPPIPTTAVTSWPVETPSFFRFFLGIQTSVGPAKIFT